MYVEERREQLRQEAADIRVAAKKAFKSRSERYLVAVERFKRRRFLPLF